MAFHKDHPWRLANPPTKVALTQYTWPTAGITTRVGVLPDKTIVVPVRDIALAANYPGAKTNRVAFEWLGLDSYHVADTNSKNRPCRCVDAVGAKRLYEFVMARKARVGRPSQRPARDSFSLIRTTLPPLEVGRFTFGHYKADRMPKFTVEPTEVELLAPDKNRPDQLYIRLAVLVPLVGLDVETLRKRMLATEEQFHGTRNYNPGTSQAGQHRYRLWQMTLHKRHLLWGSLDRDGYITGRPTQCWPVEFVQEVVDAVTNPRPKGWQPRHDALGCPGVHPLTNASLNTVPGVLAQREDEAREKQVAASLSAQMTPDALQRELQAVDQIADALAGITA